MIIVKIRTEGEPTFKEWREKVIKRIIDKKSILYKYLSSSFRIWLDLNNGLE